MKICGNEENQEFGLLKKNSNKKIQSNTNIYDTDEGKRKCDLKITTIFNLFFFMNKNGKEFPVSLKEIR